ncbi:MAG: ankyrin repeat and protein kinase domain-containing protein [Spirochaetales bacterium]
MADDQTRRLSSAPLHIAANDGTRRLERDSQGFSSFRESKLSGTTVHLNDVEYLITEVISEGLTGEADIYLVTGPDQQPLIFKRYKRDIKIKQEVVETVKALDHPHIIHVAEFGISKESFFELMAYAEGGTVLDRAPLRELSDLKAVISQTSSALAHCHSKGLVHRDIKPENLFLRRHDEFHVLVADFGIASMVDLELERKVTSRNLTFQYAAPETLTYSADNSVIIGPPVDYFALGLTIITLWLGREWCAHLPFGAIPTAIVQGDIEVPADMPAEIRHAVAGLIAHNPADRWTNIEVEQWMAGQSVRVAARGSRQIESGELAPFDFIRSANGVLAAATPGEMADLMLTYREQGIRHLYRGDIADWIRGSDRLRALEIEDIVAEYPHNQGKAESGLLKCVYTLDTDRGFVDCEWNEHSIDRGSDLADALSQIGDLIESAASSAIYLRSDHLRLYLEATGATAVWDEIQTEITHPFDAREMSEQKAVHKLVLLLQGHDTLRVLGKVFHSFDDLREADAGVHRALAREIHDDDSKFLCWLEGMYLKSDSSDIAKSETVELISLIKEMPWLREYDSQLRERLNQRGEGGYTDLMIMAKSGDLEACRELVANGAEIDFSAPDGTTAFALAALSGHLHIMEYLRDRGANINPVIREQSPLLHELVYEDNGPAAGWLLQQGVSADLDRTSDGWSPLMVAVTVGNRTMVSLLLNAGADPDLLDGRLWSPLHVAVWDGDFGTAELLLEHGSDINVCGDINRSPLHYVAGEGNLDAVRFLLAAGADANVGAESNWTPLHALSQNGNVEIARALVAAGAKPDVGVRVHTGSYGPDTISLHSLYSPPLYYAVTQKHYPLARFLVESGASMEFSEWGQGYVHRVLAGIKEQREECLKTARVLLAKGADPNQGQKSVQPVATADGSAPVMPPLAYAVSQGEVEFTRLLLDAGASTAIDYGGVTPLHEAARRGYGEIVRLLLAHGADPYVNSEPVENGSTSPFCTAARASDAGVVKAFLEAGTSVEKAVEDTPRRFNPLFCAISANKNANVEHLVEKATVNSTDREGYTPLMLAVERANVRAVDLLLAAGASKRGKTRAGLTLADLAKRSGNPELIRRFAAKGKAIPVEAAREASSTTSPFASAARTRVARRPGSVALIGLLLRVIAAALAAYAFIWAASNAFFLTSIGTGGFLIVSVLASNVLLWCFVRLRIPIAVGLSRRPIRSFLLIGALGTVVASLTGPVNLLAQIPLMTGVAQSLHLPPDASDALATHLWEAFHTPSYASVARFTSGVPLLGSIRFQVVLLGFMAVTVIVLIRLVRARTAPA